MGGMLSTSADLAEAARAAGATVMHAPISFKEDASDNPNKGLGILAGCAADRLFTEGTWNADFEESMIPQAGDLVVEGRRLRQAEAHVQPVALHGRTRIPAVGVADQPKEA